jgi:hypothetical protein
MAFLVCALLCIGFSVVGGILCLIADKLIEHKHYVLGDIFGLTGCTTGLVGVAWGVVATSYGILLIITLLVKK